MPAMPYYYVGKGTQFGMLDRQFGGSEEEFMAAYDAALARLEGPDTESLPEAALHHSDPTSGRTTGLSADDVEHFQRHWLGDWWPDHPVEEVLRNGFAAAIRRAREQRLPIEAIWLCADEDAFQVYFVEGPRQITVIVYTPTPVEQVPDELMTEFEPIWVVKVRDEWDKPDFEVVDGSGESEIIMKQVRYAPGQPGLSDD
jgi:hypothetical protein